MIIHSQTSTVQPLKFEKGYVISTHTLIGVRMRIHAFVKWSVMLLVQQEA